MADIKKEFLKKAQKAPEKYYPVAALKKLGFTRAKCTSCGRQYWSTEQRKTCGDAACVGGYSFIGKSPATKKLDYIGAWKAFADIHKKLGYTPIDRYPVVARWRDDTDFVQAGIYNFQPYVVTGEVAPPANPVVEPQFCLRFNDIDNVGITGAHYVGFVMLGEHAFYPPKEFDKEKYVQDHLTWLNEGMGLANEHIVIHEEVWAGGGNFGPALEFFSGGLEISNQVYMEFEITDKGTKPLPLKVLDMGQGLERVAWFTQGTATSYETTFPTVMKFLRKKTGLKYDEKIVTKFLPYAPLVNVDEVEDVEGAWKNVAKKIGIDVDALKKTILPLAALYSIAEHSRALLVALHDGALPSNVGGMYNLRVILRRALSFIDKYQWNIHLPDVCREHAKFLKPLFPELSENLDNVEKILTIEKSKYEQTKQKTMQLVSKLIEKKLSTKQLIDLYDTQGISPYLLQEEAAKKGKKIQVPENFYALVAEKHAAPGVQVTKTEREEKLDLKGVAGTDILYFGDWKVDKFAAKVLKIIDSFVVLDKTVFYPVSGGQLHDEGSLNGQRVVDVFKQGNVIIHRLAEKPAFKEGDSVKGEVDFERRKQLTQHHTVTHIINAAARTVLGDHINQASAKKDVEKGYLDVTHYQNISEEELERIEQEANKIVEQKVEVDKKLMERTEAEQQYGMRIYQGGAVPGKTIRIVDIKGIDAEACGGTHLNNTNEAGLIKVVKATKVKDGVVRITFAAGNAAQNLTKGEEELLDKLRMLLGVENKHIVYRAEELYNKWKEARKAVKRKKEVDIKTFDLVSTKEFTGNIIAKTAEVIKSQPAHVLKTLQRFKNELEEFKQQLS